MSPGRLAEEVREGDLASAVGATTRRAEKRAAEAAREAAAALQHRYFDEQLTAQIGAAAAERAREECGAERRETQGGEVV